MSADIQHVGVVGGGLMGSGIAEVCARAGLPVILVERNHGAVEAARSRLTSSLERAALRGRLDVEDVERVLGRVAFDTDLDMLGPSDLVIEAVPEDASAKTAVFARLDSIVRRTDAILASNTSSIPIMRLATATSRPEQVIGLHFFNPVPVLPLIETVPSLLTSPDTLVRSRAFAHDVLGKTVVTSQDRAGFVVNALLVPYLLSAVRMLESGFASAEDIDQGMVQGCAHPMGPLALTDLIGLDTTLAIADSMYREFREVQYAPPPLLARMVEAGLLGRKSGRGFHAYGPVTSAPDGARGQEALTA